MEKVVDTVKEKLAMLRTKLDQIPVLQQAEVRLERKTCLKESAKQ